MCIESFNFYRRTIKSAIGTFIIFFNSYTGRIFSYNLYFKNHDNRGTLWKEFYKNFFD